MTLDGALEAWARWVHQGPLDGYSRSNTAVLMEILASGVTGSGTNGGGKPLVCDGIEAAIEASVMALAAKNDVGHRRARVLRAEYILSLPDESREQEAKAIRLGVKLETYWNDLRAAKKAVRAALEARQITIHSNRKRID